MTDQSTGESMKDSAMTEGRRLADEAQEQARTVYAEVGDRVRGEADSQSKRAATGLRSFSNELDNMAAASDGPASSWVREGSARMAGFADRLEVEGIDGVTHDIQAFARRRPGMFLAATFGAGLLVARVAKNVDTGSITDQPAQPSQGSDRRSEPALGATGSAAVTSDAGLEADAYGGREVVR